MKLLFDQQLSPRLVNRISDIFPDSSHLMLQGLDRAEDTDVWDFALMNGYALVTRDSDFNDMSLLQGSPPKVVWIRIGNCTTGEIEALLRRYHDEIEQLEADSEGGVLVLS